MPDEPWDIPMTARYTYTRDADSCSDVNTLQQLTVEIEDAGGGKH